METPIVYIAGPVSGQPDLNRDSFYEADRELKRHGFITRNPHEFCKHIESDDPQDPRYYRQGFAELVNCTDILLLDGWQYSKGASIEKQVAGICSIRIHTSIDELISCYKSDR